MKNSKTADMKLTDNVISQYRLLPNGPQHRACRVRVRPIMAVLMTSDVTQPVWFTDACQVKRQMCYRREQD